MVERNESICIQELDNIRDTSRVKQLHQSMKILFRNFENSENKMDLTEHKISMVDLKMSEEGELSRLYKEREISIFIPTKVELPESGLDKLGLEPIKSIENRPEGLPLRKRASTSKDITNNNYCDLLKAQLLSKKEVIETAHLLKIGQKQIELNETNVGSHKIDQSNPWARTEHKAPSLIEESIFVPTLYLAPEKTTIRIPKAATERSHLKGPFTLRGRETLMQTGRTESKNSNIAGWLISQIDMFRFLNRVTFKIRKQGRCELDPLSSSLGRLKLQILKDVRQLAHLSRQERAYFQNSAQFDKIKEILDAYESKMGESSDQLEGYQNLNSSVLFGIDLIFKQVSNGSYFSQQQVKLLDYLITLWQLLKLHKRNHPEHFHNKSQILQIIDAKEVKLTIAHLLHIYERMKALKLL